MAETNLCSSAPVFAAPDVGATAKWYAEHLGFCAAFTPEEPPHAFAILSRDDVEVMLRRCFPPDRPQRDWDLYIRTRGVAALYERLRERLPIAEPLRRPPYCAAEFSLDDPNGYRLVFGED